MTTSLEHERTKRFLAAYAQLPTNFKLSIAFILADLERKKQMMLNNKSQYHET